MSARANIVPLERIEGLIYLIRGQKVMLDSDLAALYVVATKVLNQAVKRNLERFPEDFMFRLTPEETDRLLRSQKLTTSGGKERRPTVWRFYQRGTGHNL